MMKNDSIDRYEVDVISQRQVIWKLQWNHVFLEYTLFEKAKS